MSDELELKLKAIVMRFGWITEEDDWRRAISDIDQAYKESGWLEPYTMAHTAETMKSVVTYSLTPDQWLFRFKSEIESMQPLMSPAGYEKFKRYALAVAERVVA